LADFADAAVGADLAVAVDQAAALHPMRPVVALA
jgi:hypothetical protein